MESQINEKSSSTCGRKYELTILLNFCVILPLPDMIGRPGGLFGFLWTHHNKDFMYSFCILRLNGFSGFMPPIDRALTKISVSNPSSHEGLSPDFLPPFLSTLPHLPLLPPFPSILPPLISLGNLYPSPYLYFGIIGSGQ